MNECDNVSITCNVLSMTWDTDYSTIRVSLEKILLHTMRGNQDVENVRKKIGRVRVRVTLL